MSTERESPRSWTELNPAARAELETLLGREPAAIADEERDFLRARRDYLTAEQRRDYGVDKPAPKKAAKKEADEE